MAPRLGQILVNAGVLTERQLEQVLDEQRMNGHPIGVICERMFQVPPQTIERAWADQYVELSRTIDPAVEVYEGRAIDLVTRRQAWQFRVLPIRFDQHELLIATTRDDLGRALRFATNIIGLPVFFVMAAPDALGEALCRHYPIPGMSASLGDGTMKRYLDMLSPAA
jgi:hypothetical protein